MAREADKIKKHQQQIIKEIGNMVTIMGVGQRIIMLRVLGIKDLRMKVLRGGNQERVKLADLVLVRNQKAVELY